MAVVSANTLKGWFVTLAKPVQEQFWSWIDSFRHKSDKITIDDLDNPLQGVINGLAINYDYDAVGNFSRVFAEKATLEKMAIVPDDEIVLNVGTTPGGTEIMEAVTIPAGNTDLQIVEKYFHEGATLYFTGITENTYIKFFQRL